MRSLIILGLLGFALQPSPVISSRAPVLDLGCELTGEGEVTHFIVTLRNSSEEDTAVVLGIALGNGRNYYPVGLTLVEPSDSGVAPKQLRYARPIAVAGRLDSW